MSNSPSLGTAFGWQQPGHVVCLSVWGVGEVSRFALHWHNKPPMILSTMPAITKSDLRERYQRYAGKHPSPMSFKAWMYFREQGLIGAQKSTTNHSEAGKIGMAKRWGKKP